MSNLEHSSLRTFRLTADRYPTGPADISHFFPWVAAGTLRRIPSELPTASLNRIMLLGA